MKSQNHRKMELLQAAFDFSMVWNVHTAKQEQRSDLCVEGLELLELAGTMECSNWKNSCEHPTPDLGVVAEKEDDFFGNSLAAPPSAEYQRLELVQIALLFQNPILSNPLKTIILQSEKRSKQKKTKYLQ